MAALKLLETRGTRDQLVLTGTGLFLLLAACLDRQDLARAPLYALQAWLCCAAIAAIATPALPARAALRLAARALLLALPLALALFLFFPRLAGLVLGDPARRHRAHRARRHDDPGQHRAAGRRLRRRHARALRGSAPERRALLARPGAARLRRAHLAALGGLLPASADWSFSARRCATTCCSSPRTGISGSRSTRRRRPPRRACFSPTTISSLATEAGQRAGQLRRHLLPRHARARAARCAQPPRGHRAARGCQPAHPRARAGAVPESRLGRRLRRRRARLPAQRRLRLLPRAAAARARRGR